MSFQLTEKVFSLYQTTKRSFLFIREDFLAILHNIQIEKNQIYTI